MKSDNPEPWLYPPLSCFPNPHPQGDKSSLGFDGHGTRTEVPLPGNSPVGKTKLGVKWHLTRRSSRWEKQRAKIKFCIVSNTFQLSCGEIKWGHPQFCPNLNSSKYPTANFSCNNKGLQEVWKLSPLPKKTMATPSDSVWRLSSLRNREDRWPN